MSERVDLAVCMAHPDDECLVVGAWMAELSQQGKRVAVFLATAGDGAQHPTLSPSALGDVRLKESARALESLGVDPPTSPRLADGKLQALKAELKAALSAWLIEVQPRNVVTYGMDGGYGHVDHLAVTEVLLELEDSHGFQLWQTVFEPGTFKDVQGFLRRSEPCLLSESAKDTGVVKPQVTVDCPKVMEKKRKALSFYHSQLQGREVGQFLGTRAMRRLLTTEYFTPMGA